MQFVGNCLVSVPGVRVQQGEAQLSSSLYGDTVPGLHREFPANDSLAATR